MFTSVTLPELHDHQSPTTYNGTQPSKPSYSVTQNCCDWSTTTLHKCCSMTVVADYKHICSLKGCGWSFRRGRGIGCAHKHRNPCCCVRLRERVACKAATTGLYDACWSWNNGESDWVESTCMRSHSASNLVQVDVCCDYTKDLLDRHDMQHVAVK